MAAKHETYSKWQLNDFLMALDVGIKILEYTFFKANSLAITYNLRYKWDFYSDLFFFYICGIAAILDWLNRPLCMPLKLSNFRENFKEFNLSPRISFDYFELPKKRF